MTDTIDSVLADLERQSAALDPERVRREADAAVVKVQQHASALDARIHTIRTTRVTIAGLDGKLAAERAWLDALTSIREQLCKELLALPPRIYDAPTKALARNLEISIRSIDFGLLVDRYELNNLRLGELLKEAGYTVGPKQDGQTFGEMAWFGSIPEVTKRIALLDAQRADAQARLDAALMSDEDRAAKAAAIAEKNTAPVIKVRGDGSRYKKHYPSGDIEEIEDASV